MCKKCEMDAEFILLHLLIINWNQLMSTLFITIAILKQSTLRSGSVVGITKMRFQIAIVMIKKSTTLKLKLGCK